MASAGLHGSAVTETTEEKEELNLPQGAVLPFMLNT